MRLALLQLCQFACPPNVDYPITADRRAIIARREFGGTRAYQVSWAQRAELLIGVTNQLFISKQMDVIGAMPGIAQLIPEVFVPV